MVNAQLGSPATVSVPFTPEVAGAAMNSVDLANTPVRGIWVHRFQSATSFPLKDASAYEEVYFFLRSAPSEEHCTDALTVTRNPSEGQVEPFCLL